MQTHPAPSLQKALSQKFRADQVTAGTAAADAVGRLWDSSFSIGQARDSWAKIRPIILGIVSRYYTASQESGKVYYNACRLAAELAPLSPRTAARVKPMPLLARSSKTVDSTGLGWFLHEVKGGAQMMDAFTSAHDLLTSAVQALVMSGARDWIEAAAAADPQSDGIRRVTGGTCDYCEALAAEGATATQGFHNDCECTSEPSFSEDTSASPSLPDSGVRAAPSADADDLLDTAEDVTDTEASPVGSSATPIDTLIKLSKSKDSKIRAKAIAALTAMGMYQGANNGA